MTLMTGTEESEQKRQFSADHNLQTYRPHLICCKTCKAQVYFPWRHQVAVAVFAELRLHLISHVTCSTGSRHICTSSSGDTNSATSTVTVLLMTESSRHIWHVSSHPVICSEHPRLRRLWQDTYCQWQIHAGQFFSRWLLHIFLDMRTITLWREYSLLQQSWSTPAERCRDQLQH